jgi:lipid-binding SYLF domain-containing protein
MQRRDFIREGTVALAAAGLVLVTCSPGLVRAATSEEKAAKRHSIDVHVNGTLTRLYRIVKGSRELVAKANGVLVFPSVIKAAIGVGGQYGEGALRIHGRSVGYYSTAAGSVGLQLGAQSKSIIFLFMTTDALDEFRNSKGWSVGGEGSVALVKVGVNGVVDSNTATAPVEAIVLTNSGLMGDISLSGTKVSRLDI